MLADSEDADGVDGGKNGALWVRVRAMGWTVSEAAASPEESITLRKRLLLGDLQPMKSAFDSLKQTNVGHEKGQC